MSASFTGLTLFAGIGSSSRVIRDLLGGHVVGAVEYMPEAAETLRLNGFNAVEADIRTVDFRRFGRVDLIAGGPPCQPFSQAADNDGHFDDRDMIPEFIRAVAETFPKLFVMEEVQTLTWKKHRAYFEHVLECFEALGYLVAWKIVNTADHGVGQARKRLVVVGARIDLGITPVVPNPGRDWVSMATALEWDETECRKRNLQAPEKAVVDDDRCLWPLARPSTTVVGSYRPEVQAAPGYRRAGDGPRQNTPGSVVTTFEERLTLQDLPADWKVAGSQAKRDLQVGNSCPSIVLADIIAANIPNWTEVN